MTVELEAPATDVPVLVGASIEGLTFWREGQRLHHLFEERCDNDGFWRSRKRIAVEYDNAQYSFRALDALANKIARFLLANNVKAGDRIALLFDRSVYSLASVLAVSKIDATYVPLDPGFPPDRIAYIVQDSQVSLALTLSQFDALFADSPVRVVSMDIQSAEIESHSGRRPTGPSSGRTADRTCYVIYTSGSTGRPKGVAVRQSNICSFLRSACRSYGYLETDRVYQGMTMAFDYSVEESWVPLLCGATLVPAPSGVNLLGSDLAEFLQARRISAMCCVPTLLATLDRDLPGLRFLMVSGEACPQDLADKWSAQRRFLNTYGPTEATVTATWSAMEPGNKVSIGAPLPGYSIAILSPDKPTVLARGESGEIAIAGVGVAEGYLNLPEQTSRAFVEDFVGLPDNPSARIYRTGDLGRINENGQIDYQGRIDAQVKIRGYRIELDEIAAVVRATPGVGQAVVHPYEPQPGAVELVAYFTNADDATPVDGDAIHTALKERLPPYMVPAFIEPINDIPLLPSTKVDRKALPAPAGQRFMMSGNAYVAPASEMQETLANHLARLLKVDRISVDAHFFDELGANSLIMARYLSAVRKQLGAIKVSMKAIYQNPTIASLATALGDEQAAGVPDLPDNSAAAPVGATQLRAAVAIGTGMVTASSQTIAPIAAAAAARASASDPARQTARAPGRDPHRVAPQWAYLACGFAQLSYMFMMAFIAAFAFLVAIKWVVAADGEVWTFARAIVAGSTVFLSMTALMIATKWLAVGRFTPGKIELWSFKYLRFWIARAAVVANPLNLFAGTPLYTVYLRMLGASIGKRTVLFSPAPICADLVTIGDDTIVRQDCNLQGYIARDGYVYCGGIEIGSRSLVAEACVLEINTVIGNEAQLGTSSALLEGAIIPDGKVYQGSPAEPSNTRFDLVPPEKMPAYQPVLYTTMQVLTLMFIVLPLPTYLLAQIWNRLLADSIVHLNDWHSAAGLFQALPSVVLATAGAYLLSLLTAQLFVVIVPRIYNLFVRPGLVHRLYGIQYYLARAVARTSQSRALSHIYGDSSLITHFLSAVGYDLSENTQTGSNFGVTQLHHSPFLIKFNRNTLVSDGLTMLNMEVSSTSFRLRPVQVAGDNYLGNALHWPAASRVGPDCLIATKAMIPIDGDIRTGVGILGSPPFEIPRSVMSDRRFDHAKEPQVLKTNLKLKLRSNLVTIALYMSRIWSQAFLLAFVAYVMYGMAASAMPTSTVIPALLIASLAILTLLAVPAYIISFERLFQYFHPTRPLYCSLYDKKFWLHERFWKLNYNDLLMAFSGTPFKSWYSRMQGVKIGRQVFDDGSIISEPMLAEVGDYSCLNNHAVIQSHSLEDGTFKSDYSRIGGRCNIGVRGFIHYGTMVNDGVSIQSDSFLMKGSIIEAGETWLGNPARDSLAGSSESGFAAVNNDYQAPLGKAA